MKFLRILFFFALTLKLIKCEIFVNSLNANVTTISQVLHDIVDEFLLKENIKFNIKVFHKISQLQEDILTDFMSKTGSKFNYRLTFDDLRLDKRANSLNHSNIIAIRSLEDIFHITETHFVVRYPNQPIKYFVLVPSFTFDQLKNSWINDKNYAEEISVFAGTMIFYSYFITNEIDTVTLSTIEWFSPHGCSTPNLRKINTFNKKSIKWAKKLKNYEKFLNYHGCELVMMLPVPEANANYQTSGFAILDPSLTEFSSIGISPAVFQISSKFYNFTPQYQPVFMRSDFYNSYYDQDIDLVPINGNVEIVQHRGKTTWRKKD